MVDKEGDGNISVLSETCVWWDEVTWACLPKEVSIKKKK
jgi:hypothetical protein